MSKTDPQLHEGHGFQRLISTRKIGDNGLLQNIQAKPDELARLAAFLDLIAVDALSVEIKITRWRTRGIKVVGSLSAKAVQSCVVTLEPVPEIISSEFERRYLPQDLLGPDVDETDVFVDPEGEDPPEALTNEIDMGEVLVEELSLNLNPYPRKEGTAFEVKPEPLAEEKIHPFAGLAKLKSKLDPKA